MPSADSANNPVLCLTPAVPDIVHLNAWSLRSPAQYHCSSVERPSGNLEDVLLRAQKIAYVARFGLGEFIKRELIHTVTGPYVIMFDESLNQTTKTKQLDVHVRFWNNGIKSRYLGSQFVGHGTALGLLKHVKKSLDQLDNSRLMSVSMDGPNVNFKFFELLQLDHAENYGGAQLVSVGSSRREDYVRVTKSTVFPQPFCGHRWLENLPVIERALAVWPSLNLYLDAVHRKELPNPKTASFDTIEAAHNDPLTIAKMHFFMTVARTFDPFTRKYQTNKPVMPFFGKDLAELN
ncbi:hypothetical protein DPX16_23240 [Anabarilius grahami]|uniref:Uncharacterized protein n=1 Tax=Anabarilius grahami TaxID=495550 RepID=A0A3N0Z499_ANAGA|nr:hypothetical protein DPX16_23240 [Anabarilius grahami]